MRQGAAVAQVTLQTLVQAGQVEGCAPEAATLLASYLARKDPQLHNSQLPGQPQSWFSSLPIVT